MSNGINEDESIPEMIQLNIGGHLFTTTLATLHQVCIRERSENNKNETKKEKREKGRKRGDTNGREERKGKEEEEYQLIYL